MFVSKAKFLDLKNHFEDHVKNTNKQMDGLCSTIDELIKQLNIVRCMAMRGEIALESDKYYLDPENHGWFVQSICDKWAMVVPANDLNAKPKLVKKTVVGWAVSSKQECKDFFDINAMRFSYGLNMAMETRGISGVQKLYNDQYGLRDYLGDL